jgi:hypothetical protein
MIQYIFDSDKILKGKRVPNRNSQYNPENPLSQPYNYNPRDSVLREEEIALSQWETLRWDGGDLITVVKDMRGRAAWKKDTGQGFFIDYAGDFKDEDALEAPSRPDNVWDYDQDCWIDGRDFSATLTAAEKRIQEHYADIHVKRIGKTYPVYEQQTWELQRSEAEQPTLPTPFIDIILAGRDKEAFVADIQYRATRYDAITKEVLSQQYAKLNELKQCTSLAEIDSILEGL